MASPQTAPVAPTPRTEITAVPDPVDTFHWLPCDLTADIRVANFTVHRLLSLAVGSVVPTMFRVAEDVTLHVNRTALAKARFEVVEHRLAIRITELL